MTCAGLLALAMSHAVAVEAGLEVDVGGVSERAERSGIVGRDASCERLEGEGAVHGAAFDIEQAETLGEGAGDGALPCSGGTIDGNDERQLTFAHLKLLSFASLTRLSFVHSAMFRLLFLAH